MTTKHDFPLDFETGLCDFSPVDRGTRKRLDFKIVYRTFPNGDGYHGIVLHPDTKVRYRVLGKECDIKGCHCDAWVEKIDDDSFPDFYPAPEHDYWSVDAMLPPDLEERIASEDNAEPGQIRTTIIHGYLWKTRTLGLTKIEQQMDFMSDIHPALQQVDQGDTITAEEWRETFDERLQQRLEELRDIPQGNLPLPERLYLFVLEQVDSGLFPSASAFISAAIHSPQETAEHTVDGRRFHFPAFQSQRQIR